MEMRRLMAVVYTIRTRVSDTINSMNNNKNRYRKCVLVLKVLSSFVDQITLNAIPNLLYTVKKYTMYVV